MIKRINLAVRNMDRISSSYPNLKDRANQVREKVSLLTSALSGKEDRDESLGLVQIYQFLELANYKAFSWENELINTAHLIREIQIVHLFNLILQLIKVVLKEIENLQQKQLKTPPSTYSQHFSSGTGQRSAQGFHTQKSQHSQASLKHRNEALSQNEVSMLISAVLYRVSPTERVNDVVESRELAGRIGKYMKIEEEKLKLFFSNTTYVSRLLDCLKEQLSIKITAIKEKDEFKFNFLKLN